MEENKEQQQQNMIVEYKDSLKLIKNTKGYNWEIRLISLDIEKLQEIDLKMRELWGAE